MKFAGQNRQTTSHSRAVEVAVVTIGAINTAVVGFGRISGQTSQQSESAGL